MHEKERMKRRGKKRKTEGEKERGEVGEDGAEEVVRRARCCARSWSCKFMSAGVLSCQKTMYSSCSLRPLALRILPLFLLQRSLWSKNCVLCPICHSTLHRRLLCGLLGCEFLP